MSKPFSRNDLCDECLEVYESYYTYRPLKPIKINQPGNPRFNVSTGARAIETIKQQQQLTLDICERKHH